VRQQREADCQAGHLFQTLLHRAFRGEVSEKESREIQESLEELGWLRKQAVLREMEICGRM
jgi:hypothetical protein